MKLHIRTDSKKILEIEIDNEIKTVLDLKQKLSKHPDVGVNPERQMLMIDDRILSNHELIKSINTREIIVLTIISESIISKTSKTISPVKSLQITNISDVSLVGSIAEGYVSDSELSPQTTAFINERERAIERLIALGYSESNVRRALRASHNVEENALIYLKEGIPTTPSLPSSSIYPDSDDEMANLAMCVRNDPYFANNTLTIANNPEMIEQAIQHLSETHPSILSLVQNNRQLFLDVLMENVNVAQNERLAKNADAAQNENLEQNENLPQSENLTQNENATQDENPPQNKNLPQNENGTQNENIDPNANQNTK